MKRTVVPTWTATVQSLIKCIHGPAATPASRESAIEALMNMAVQVDRINEEIAEDQKRSLWDRITPQELAAEDAVLMPRALLQDGQIDELIAWMRKTAEKANTEANELRDFGNRRAGKNVLPMQR